MQPMYASITTEDLVRVIGTAFEDGYHGCLDCKDGYVVEALEKMLRPVAQKSPPKFVPVEAWRNYTVKEIKQYNPGTIFEHSRLGYYWLENEQTVTGFTRIAVFPDGRVGYLETDAIPWTEPIRRVVPQ